MRKSQRKPEAQAQAIDLTPMLDVVFIMLIFFIVTATFIKVPGVDVMKTEAISASSRKAAILVAINSNNEIWIDKNQVAPDAVKLQLIRLHTENPKGGLVIQADNNANVETLGLVADSAIEIGLTDIAVSTLTE
ncbi:MAG: biopolymer transporter ExbD [Gammaproteobacteria bacterium BRH_c0]|nr:MAG: biopolymer transporter ExbD [Gammaproteobacteria bacterium BRH_c0]